MSAREPVELLAQVETLTKERDELKRDVERLSALKTAEVAPVLDRFVERFERVLPAPAAPPCPGRIDAAAKAARAAFLGAEEDSWMRPWAKLPAGDQELWREIVHVVLAKVQGAPQEVST